MVNIRFFVDGKKIIENEYSDTSITNLNDVIKRGNIQKDKIYKVSFCRIFEESNYKKELDLYLVNHRNNYQVYKISDFRKYTYPNFYPDMLSMTNSQTLNSKWKIYFNKMDDIKFVELKTELTNTNSAFQCPVNYTTFISKEHDMNKFTTYKNYEVEIEKMILNDKEVNGLIYEDFTTTNVLINKICILKSIPSRSSYCIVC
jgi:hypothetical protein